MSEFFEIKSGSTFCVPARIQKKARAVIDDSLSFSDYFLRVFLLFNTCEYSILY